MESKRFEDSFKNAFEGAEHAPTENVWTNVELELEKASGGKMKRSLLMFQLLAAASTVFALGIGGLYYLTAEKKINSTNELSYRDPESTSVKEADTKNKSLPDASEKAHGEQIAASHASNSAHTNSIADSGFERHDRKSRNNHNNHTNGVDVNTDKNKPSVGSSPSGSQPEKNYGKAFDRVALGSLAQVKPPVFNLQKLTVSKQEEFVQPDPGMVLLAQLKDREKQYEQEEKKQASAEKLWTSVGVGAGSYNPGGNSSPAVSFSNLVGSNRIQQHDQSAGMSYTVGVNVAGRVSNRFILQGGVSYLTQQAEFTSTLSQHGMVARAEAEFIDAKNFSDYEPANPYTVNNNLQFISIPVQAGYLILDKAFAIQLNGGVATDFFVQNTLTAGDTEYASVKQSAADSPYRSVTFNGLLGTEFSYRIAHHYRISLNPGLRYSLNSIYKSDVATGAEPLTYDVSVRFRYIFK